MCAGRKLISWCGNIHSEEHTYLIWLGTGRFIILCKGLSGSTTSSKCHVPAFPLQELVLRSSVIRSHLFNQYIQIDLNSEQFESLFPCAKLFSSVIIIFPLHLFFFFHKRHKLHALSSLSFFTVKKVSSHIIENFVITSMIFFLLSFLAQKEKKDFISVFYFGL